MVAQEVEVTAFVLHRRPYRETSFLTTFFSASEGKFTAVVKGVRPSQGRRRQTLQQKQAWLQPFQPLRLRWREKPETSSELVTLRQFEPEPNTSCFQNFSHLWGEVHLCGLYMNELLYRLLYPRVAVEGVFDAYQAQLSALASLKQSPQVADRQQMGWILRQFEFQLLLELEGGVNLAEDIFQAKIEPHRHYWFYPNIGLVPKETLSDTLDAKFLTAQTTMQPPIEISGNCILALRGWEFCTDCLPIWKKLFRKLLMLHLGNQPLMTPQLMRALYTKG